MDEECLALYEAGGMSFEDIEDFDEWFLRDGNCKRFLPNERSIVAFRVRHYDKERHAESISDFINFFYEDQYNRQTFLYIRNGDQFYRMQTGIDFGEHLFPDQEHSVVLGQHALWAKLFAGSVDKVITDAQYQGLVEDHAAEMAKWREKEAAWDKMSKKEQEGRCSPWRPSGLDHYERCTPESVFYDDAMELIAKAAKDHNRVAVVLQGLLDRSPAFHPHPPWQLFKPEGFINGIALVYDDSRALVPGDEPDFKAFRAKLNETLARGSMTVGQEITWEMREAEKENDRRSRSYHEKRDYNLTRYRPYGNPGPGTIAKVIRLGRDKKCTFEWERERQDWRSHTGAIPARITCSSTVLMNVDAYKAGDFKIFYNDPRTRAKYLKWAPYLLAAEDYVGRKTKKKKRQQKKKGKRR